METIATLTLNKSSQTTIPKKVREILGVNLGDRLSVRRGAKKNEIILSREPSAAEALEELQKILSTPAKNNVEKLKRKYKNRSADLINDQKFWYLSEEGNRYYKKYGVKA